MLWLAAAAVVGWLAWQWFRRQQGGLAHSSPQFAPPRPLEGYIPPAASTGTPTPPTQPAETAPATPGVLDQPTERGAAEATPAPEVEAVPERVPGAAEGAAPSEDDLSNSVAAEGAAPTTGAASNVPAPQGEPITAEVTGYCVRCKTKRPIQHAHEETTESGRRAARGTCPVCGSNMFTFLKDNAEEIGG
jgi:hypothetical protein